ncbi:acetylornithine aminotransferase apoenzyme [Desulfuromusa kysingii]|uniref:Acetylornithine aminotransferase n=1 Tax=Desulfuromusa kysingii TaxID=37625 RepID=A0A1H3VXA4_9BACT|nr:acetylornithine transaminase [Desulfuromusa kysingii]SDZ79370.1 acetylornithine aminotransferase apoenzyme [Desulfuromusa kysingii]
MNKSQNWIDRGLAHVANTYGRFPLVAASGKGCWLTDIDGKRYLDFLAGVAVNSLGHCHPKVVAALQEQAAKLLHCSNYYHIPQQIELAEILCEHSFGDRVFFCNSGAEANEAALKLVRKYSADTYGTDRFEIITAIDSFHGRTLATISATGQDRIQSGFAPLISGFKYVPFGDIAALKTAIGPKTCAIMMEPIQGEGGINVPPQGYLQAARELCDKHNLLLIFDEIQVGLGRTGKLFAYEHDNVEPDVMTLAKALAAGPPIGAMIAREKYATALSPGTHGSTFGGNPLLTAAGVAAMKVLLEDHIIDNCVAMGNYLKAQLEQLQNKYTFIKNIRGRGLILGMELTFEGAEIVKTALQRGLLINCTAGKVLRFVPPLIVTQDEIDQMIEILDGILKEL